MPHPIFICERYGGGTGGDGQSSVEEKETTVSVVPVRKRDSGAVCVSSFNLNIVTSTNHQGEALFLALCNIHTRHLWNTVRIPRVCRSSKFKLRTLSGLSRTVKERSDLLQSSSLDIGLGFSEFLMKVYVSGRLWRMREPRTNEFL